MSAYTRYFAYMIIEFFERKLYFVDIQRVKIEFGFVFAQLENWISFRLSK